MPTGSAGTPVEPNPAVDLAQLRALFAAPLEGGFALETCVGLGGGDCGRRAPNSKIARASAINPNSMYKAIRDCANAATPDNGRRSGSAGRTVRPWCGKSLIKRAAVPGPPAAADIPGTAAINAASRPVAAVADNLANSAASCQGSRFMRASADRTLSSSLSAPIVA